MRICVYGAGATGGHFAVKLALAGHDVSVVARGAHLQAIRQDGLTLLAGDTRRHARPRASADPTELGVQDVVLMGVKATGLPATLDGLAPLLGPATRVVFPQNGMAWWYRLGLRPGLPAPPPVPIFRLEKPFLALLRPEQVVGGNIYSANVVETPGIVRNNSLARNALVIGGADGTAEVSDIRAALTGAGLQSPAVPDIRQVLWSKLLLNMSGSVIALATENRSSICRTDPALGVIYRRVIAEGFAIAAAHGYPVTDIDPEVTLANANDHKPSLLQDYEQRRPMEIAEIVEAPQAFARSAGVPTPTLDVLAAIVGRRARDRGLVPEGGDVEDR